MKLRDLDRLLVQLQGKKRKIEISSLQTDLRLYQAFLNRTKTEKLLQLEKLTQELQCLNDDTDMIQQLLNQTGDFNDASPQSLSKASDVDQVPEASFSKKRSIGVVCINQQLEDDSNLVVPTPSKTHVVQSMRLNAHLPDLQSRYFGWRLKLQQGKVNNADLPEEHRSFSHLLNRCSTFSSFRTISSLHYADNFFNFPSSIVSTIEIDKDDEFFATAGVTRKIKIYDFKSVVEDQSKRSGFINASRIHEYADVSNSLEYSPPKYPVREMACQSKVSCMSWNLYIKPYLATSDYEGIVSVWDTSVGGCVLRLDEHEKRAWTVDFSVLNPTQMASGGDDNKVKLWSTNQRYSVGTINAKANVCSVKFHPTNGNHIAFGSADHHIHYYDLRMMDTPLRVYQGHKKAVSYVKFLNANEMVSASTDCSLRLWSVNDAGKCLRSFMGHTNERHFVGLSVNSTGEFISCGSETNQVFAYYSQITRPIATHRFGNSIDALTGSEMVVEDNSQFVSSVCWKRNTPNVLIAANSQGRVKVLEMF